MSLFEVYPLFPVQLVKGKGCHVYDKNGTEYLDLYGGHAVGWQKNWYRRRIIQITNYLWFPLAQKPMRMP